MKLGAVHNANNTYLSIYIALYLSISLSIYLSISRSLEGSGGSAPDQRQDKSSGEEEDKTNLNLEFFHSQYFR